MNYRLCDLLFFFLAFFESASMPFLPGRENYGEEFNVVSDPTPTSVPPPPSFQLGAINTSLVISAGQKAYLHCLVRNMGDRAVSWIRRSDVTLLTVGETRYTHDERFTPIHAARKSDSSSPELDVDAWILQITHARVEDSGDYECQVSYHDDMEKKLKMPFTLKVLDSHARIHESRDLYVQKGSRLRLPCAVVNSSAPPAFVYWYRNDVVLNYSPGAHIQEWLARAPTAQTTSSTTTAKATRKKPISLWRDSMLVVSDDNDEVKKNSRAKDTTAPEKKAAESASTRSDGIVSILTIERVTPEHTGNYTCAPSNARQASVLVHVVDDESGPAAMQHGNGGGGGGGYSSITGVLTLVAAVSRTNAFV